MKFKKIISVASIALLGLVSCNKEEKSLVGFDIELAKEFGNELGVEVVFQEIVWEQKEIELQSKNIDLVWNGMTITDERKNQMEISMPYLTNQQVLVSKNISSFDKNTNYQVSFEAGSSGELLFNSNSDFTNSKSVVSNSQIDALTEVLSGTSDLALIDSTMAGYYLNSDTSFKNLNILNYETEKQSYGIAARKGEVELINKVNEVLTKLYNNGTTEKIAQKYGLTECLIEPNYTNSTSSDDSLNYILQKKKIVIGYTVFAPIAYFN